jgi:hypothetical protein
MPLESIVISAGAQNLTGENLKIVWAEFLTFSCAMDKLQFTRQNLG